MKIKIKELHIKGFKSLKDVEWYPGDLNVIIGSNASGKSNFLRFLELMSKSAKGELGKHIISLGGMKFIVWNNEANEIYFNVRTQTTKYSSYQLELRESFGTNGYKIVNEQLLTTEKKNKNLSYACLDRNGEDAFLCDENMNVSRRSLEKIPNGESFLSIYNDFLDVCNSAIPDYKKLLKEITIYHDVDVTEKSQIRLSAVARVDKQVESNGENLVSVLHTHYTNDKKFKENIDAAMKASFGEQYEALSFPPAADQRIQLSIQWKNLKRPSSATILSDGTLRFLFLITILVCPELPSVIAIDEPETGLHPGMFPIIAEFAAEAAKRSQIIITTHSAQLLDSFSDKNPTTTVTTLENGETKMS